MSLPLGFLGVRGRRDGSEPEFLDHPTLPESDYPACPVVAGWVGGPGQEVEMRTPRASRSPGNGRPVP